MLLAANGKIKGLKGEGFSSVEMAQQIQNHRF
jgi:hypothetical protein